MADKRRLLTDVKIDSVSVVAAPKCEGCGEPMKGLDSICWTCTNDKCERAGNPVTVPNCYPFKVIKKDTGFI